MPLINLSLLRDPFGLTHVSKRRFTFLTATSARPLDCGLYAEDSLWCTPHRDRNCLTNCSSVAAVSEEPVNVKRSSAISSTPPQTVCSTKDSSVQPTKVTGKSLTERDSYEASSVLQSEATVPTVECSPAPLEPRNLRSRGENSLPGPLLRKRRLQLLKDHLDFKT